MILSLGPKCQTFLNQSLAIDLLPNTDKANTKMLHMNPLKHPFMLLCSLYEAGETNEQPFMNMNATSHKSKLVHSDHSYTLFIIIQYLRVKLTFWVQYSSWIAAVSFAPSLQPQELWRSNQGGWLLSRMLKPNLTGMTVNKLESGSIQALKW